MLGIDSSTQSTKALLVDADDGVVVDQATAPHPPGTEVDPRAWLEAVDTATSALLDRADAVAVGGQQHGMVALDDEGEPVRDALLWNDTRSAARPSDLIAETAARRPAPRRSAVSWSRRSPRRKLRWLRDHEPEHAARVERVLLPHDYVSPTSPSPGRRPFTDRGDASGTGYFSTREGRWRPDLLERRSATPRRCPASSRPGAVGRADRERGQLLGAGTGDNMGAALGMALAPGDVLVSVGTSGVASAVSPTPGRRRHRARSPASPTPPAASCPMVDHHERRRASSTSRPAGSASTTTAWPSSRSSAPPGADGVTLLPYYGGERTPNRPGAVGTWTGLRPTTTRARPRAGGVRSAALLARRRRRPPRAAHRPEQPRPVLLVGGATRSAAAARARPGGPRPAGPAAAAGRVRRPRRRPPGRLGAGRHRRAADVAGRRGRSCSRPTPPPTSASVYADLRDRTATWT